MSKQLDCCEMFICCREMLNKNLLITQGIITLAPASALPRDSFFCLRTIQRNFYCIIETALSAIYKPSPPLHLTLYSINNAQHNTLQSGCQDNRLIFKKLILPPHPYHQRMDSTNTTNHRSCPYYLQEHNTKLIYA